MVKKEQMSVVRGEWKDEKRWNGRTCDNCGAEANVVGMGRDSGLMSYIYVCEDCLNKAVEAIQ